MNLHMLREGVRIGLHGIKTKITGPRQYSGSAEEICEQIVEACWDEKLGIFITCLHNYPIFYARDFGMCVDSLLKLGYREKVKKTVVWALEKYEKKGRITQQINRGGKPFNFPDVESPDAYAFFLHTLVSLDDQRLIEQYSDFLEKDIQRFVEKVVNPTTGLCKRGMHLGGMRDYAIRDSSCYDNTMLAAIKKYAKKLCLKSNLEQHDYEKLLIETFWNGSYFKDDMKNKELTGDANVLPFWFTVVPKKYLTSVVKEVQKRQLDKPVVLRYEPCRNNSVKMHWLDSLAGEWERDTAWIFLGNMFMQVLAQHDKKLAKKYFEGHKKMIEKERNYPEVLDKDGKPHTGLFFHSEESMLWACNFLALSPMLERLPRKR